MSNPRQAELIKKSRASYNYTHIPAPERVRPAVVGPGTTAPLSHLRPIQGGINARLHLRFTATSPILAGDASQEVQAQRSFLNRKEQQTEIENFPIRITRPLRLSANGAYCLSGSTLLGMLKSVYRVASDSYFAPINRHYVKPTKGKPGLGEYAISSFDIHKTANPSLDGNRRPGGLSPEKKADAIEKLQGSMQTIAQYAERTYGTRSGPVLDWTSALFGFVIGEDKKQKDRAATWQPEWPDEIKEAFPQGIQSRVAMSFAVLSPDQQPIYWPEPDRFLVIPGAGAKVVNPAYVWNTGRDVPVGDFWKMHDSVLAGLKVYPVHDPKLDALKSPGSGGSTERLKSEVEIGITNSVRKSDTFLQFLFASEDTPIAFEGWMDCHNLHPDEFAALMWSLFLGDVPGELEQYNADLRHNAGHLKQFGMGQLAVSLLQGSIIWVNPSPGNAGPVEHCDNGALMHIETAIAKFSRPAPSERSEFNRRLLLKCKSRANGKRWLDSERLKPFAKPHGGIARQYDSLKSENYHNRAFDLEDDSG